MEMPNVLNVLNDRAGNIGSRGGRISGHDRSADGGVQAARRNAIGDRLLLHEGLNQGRTGRVLRAVRHQQGTGAMPGVISSNPNTHIFTVSGEHSYAQDGTGAVEVTLTHESAD